MDWLIFGDDWGLHASTTQHLARNLPASDRVLWVNSIGMRAPQLVPKDIRRLFAKGRSMLSSPIASPGNRVQIPQNLTVLSPIVVPWHLHPWIHPINRRSLQGMIRRAMQRNGIRRVAVLAANPVGILYLDGLPTDSLSYLRLDNYAKMAGVDPALAEQAEERMFASADFIFATARNLLPGEGRSKARGIYLPHGVDIAHFGAIPLEPPRSRVVGFYGLMDERIDHQLVLAVTAAFPDWTFDFVGPIRTMPASMRTRPNVRLHPGVSYAELPSVIRNWDAAWIPYTLDEWTMSINPLKLREYLAAGLAAFSTPLPEAKSLAPWVTTGASPDDVKTWLANTVQPDNASERGRRRESVSHDSWVSRADMVRALIAARSPRTPVTLC